MDSLPATGYQPPDGLDDDDAGMPVDFTGSTSIPDGLQPEATPRLMQAVSGLVRQQTIQSMSSLGSDSDGMSVDGDVPVAMQVNRMASVIQSGDDFNGGSGFGSFASSSTTVNRRIAGTAGSTAVQGRGRHIPDVRKFIFQRAREKRIMSGLQVPPFTRQVFISSFAVGMAIGSVLAIVFKLFTNITSRIF